MMNSSLHHFQQILAVERGGVAAILQGCRSSCARSRRRSFRRRSGGFRR
jgi:hypothetical protein